MSNTQNDRFNDAFLEWYENTPENEELHNFAKSMEQQSLHKPKVLYHNTVNQFLSSR